MELRIILQLHFILIIYTFYINAQKPNILFILADDYGWNDVGYHDSEIQTPTLDKLASSGVKLENYYVQPICTPSRSQLLSGRYQIHTGLQHDVIMPAQPWGLKPEFPTIANKLQKAGYSTHIIGKWHVGFFRTEYLPTQRGFDSSFGYYCGDEAYYTHDRCVKVSAKGQVYNLCGIDLHKNDQPFNASGVYSTHLFVQHTEKIVHAHVTSNSTKPLFLYLPFQAVHAPLQVPDEYIDRYQHIKDKNRRLYAGMVSCLDEAVANVTTIFKKYGLWENTVMIFSTDNGGQVLEGGNNWPLRGWKGSYWEGGTRAVGFVHSSFLQQTGVICRELIHISDWFPTLLHLAGESTDGLNLDGFNVWSTISANLPSPRKELLHNIDPLAKLVGDKLDWSPFDNRVRAAIRVGRWKLITGHPGGNGSWVPPPHFKEYRKSSLKSDVVHFVQKTEVKYSDFINSQFVKPLLYSNDMFYYDEPEDKNIWLFDIVDDPHEYNDISNSRPDVVADLLTRLAYYNSTAVPVFFKGDDPNADPAKHGGYWSPWLD